MNVSIGNDECAVGSTRSHVLHGEACKTGVAISILLGGKIDGYVEEVADVVPSLKQEEYARRCGRGNGTDYTSLRLQTA